MYVKPEDVVSPKNRWKLREVLIDTGEGGHALAFGLFDGEFALCTRWNGDDGGLGSPQSRGLPTWHVLPAIYHEGILNLDVISPEQRQRIKTLLNIGNSAPRNEPSRD